MQHIWRKRIKRVLLLTALPIMLAFTLAASLIVADGLTDDIHAADVAIVPGNTVEKDGRPSARLRARLDQTVALYRQGLFPNVIVSGGVGSEGFDEAEVMKRYLVENGVPDNRIHVDSGGATTHLTARNAARMMRENAWQSAMVISQYFHVSRTRLALKRSGVTPVFSAHARYFELRDLYSIAREVVGYGTYLLRADY
ncbi:MAG TPA: YdcF family protein [Pyrinomonadaceae bacterium]|jgi:vancomycin permeability regulator SanA